MPDTCAHGQAPSQCLICSTLGLPGSRAGGGAGRAHPVPSGGVAAGPPGGRRGSVTVHVAGAVVALAAIGLVAWLVAGVVFAVLHVLELVAVAAAAGWAGYRIGRMRGPRRPA